MSTRIFIWVTSVCFFSASWLMADGFTHFITRQGHRLMDGEREFRFISFNVPNLNYVEDELAFERPHPYALPTSYEIADVIESVRQMGGTVIRNYTFPVRRRGQGEDVPTYVLGPGRFDERAFATMDTVLALANLYGIRLILPFVNMWQWMGGRPQYAEFRGKKEDDFWSDPRLIADFKKTIRHVILRRNTVTGIRYRDDRAILCWETGNELVCPHAWTQQIIAYIKRLDPNHLVMDAYHAIDDRTVREASVADPRVDIVTSHHYARSAGEVIAHIRQNVEIIGGRKPYLIGEFGFLPASETDRVLRFIREENRIAGALLWSLRYHRHLGGFYWHSEPFGHGLYKAYHWPGFDSGEPYQEREVLALMREHAYGIQNLLPPPLPIPKSPVLLPIPHVAAISWRGSSGASGYDVERAAAPEGPWLVVEKNISDAEVPYRPLFADRTARIGETYYYRVIAHNASGRSAPSNPVGPVVVVDQRLIDEMRDFTEIKEKKGNLLLRSGDDRKFKEDPHRLEGTAGAEVYYEAPGTILRVRVYAFSEQEGPTLSFFFGKTRDAKEPADALFWDFFRSGEDYGYWRPLLYRIEASPSSPRGLRIRFDAPTQIGRIEIDYRNP